MADNPAIMRFCILRRFLAGFVFVADLKTVGNATGAVRATIPDGITPAMTLFVGSSVEQNAGALMGTALMNGVGSPTFISILSSTTTYWVNGNSVAAGVAFEIQ